MKHDNRTGMVLMVLSVVLLFLAAAFSLNLWGRLQPTSQIPLVDGALTEPGTFRQSYAAMVLAKADLSDFDCYACHEKGKPPPLRFDTNHIIIIPKEHETIVMGHGSHNRNNLCFNCHDEQNLELLQARDGRALKFTESTSLCGSCHGPTYRDWDAGVHGRTGGYWNKESGALTKLTCVDCHNPHNPKIPKRNPLPPPHPLRSVAASESPTKH
jgi:hypothetical protein